MINADDTNVLGQAKICILFFLAQKNSIYPPYIYCVKTHISTIYGLMTARHNDQLPVGVIAQLIKDCPVSQRSGFE